LTTPTARTWAPKMELSVAAWVLAAAAAVWTAFADDPPGKVLLGTLALALALAGVYGVVVRPRLAADAEGVTVRGLTGRRSWTWAEVNIRLVRTRRLGREVATLELDAVGDEPDLVVLGRLDLGEDPVDVVDALLAMRI
jgi:Bacterial PH domain